MKIYTDDISRIKLFFEQVNDKEIEKLSSYSFVHKIDIEGYFKILDMLVFTGIISYVSNPLNLPYEPTINNKFKLLEEKHLNLFAFLQNIIKNKDEIKLPSSDLEQKLHSKIDAFFDIYYELIEDLNNFLNPNKIELSNNNLDFKKLRIKNGVILFDDKQITKPLGKNTQPLKFINSFVKNKNSIIGLKIIFKEVFEKSKHSNEKSFQNMRDSIKKNIKFSKNYRNDTPLKFRITYPSDEEISLTLVEVKK